MRILIISAGMSDPSNSLTLSEAFAEGMGEVPDVQVETLRLKDMRIEHFSLDHYLPGRPEDDDFPIVQEAMERASALVIATPIWNFSVPAHLKNLIDRMGSFCLDSATRTRGTLGGMPFFLIFTGGAPLPAWKGLMRFTTSSLREGLRYFGATPAGSHFEPKCTKCKGHFTLVVDHRPRSLQTLRKNGERFARLVKDFKETGKKPLRLAMMERLYGFGQRIMNWL